MKKDELMLQKLFISKHRINLIYFFLFEAKEHHLREISKMLNIPVSAVKKEIDNLLLLGVIKVKGKQFSLNKNCSFVEDLKNLFVKTDFAVYPLKKILISNKIEYILIFGSFANAKASGESDIDLLVVGDIKLSDVVRQLQSVENKIKREINPVVWTLSNLRKEKKSGFIKDVFKKNIIMIKGDENELRQIVK